MLHAGIDEIWMIVACIKRNAVASMSRTVLYTGATSPLTFVAKHVVSGGINGYLLSSFGGIRVTAWFQSRTLQSGSGCL